MIHKCTFLKILEIFFLEPTTVHFIKEISRRIKIAPTSVRKHISELLKRNLIQVKKSRPFNGFVSNRDNDEFIFLKRVYNLYSLRELTNFLVSNFYPKLIVVYGSYAWGEDIEDSDIDIFILSTNKKNIKLENFEKELERKIHLFCVDNFKKVDRNLKKNILNGIVLYGGF